MSERPLVVGSTYTFRPSAADGYALMQQVNGAYIPWDLTGAVVNLVLVDIFGISSLFPAQIISAALGTVRCIQAVPLTWQPGQIRVGWQIIQAGITYDIDTVPKELRAT